MKGLGSRLRDGWWWAWEEPWFHKLSWTLRTPVAKLFRPVGVLLPRSGYTGRQSHTPFEQERSVEALLKSCPFRRRSWRLDHVVEHIDSNGMFDPTEKIIRFYTTSACRAGGAASLPCDEAAGRSAAADTTSNAKFITFLLLRRGFAFLIVHNFLYLSKIFMSK